MNKKNFMLCLGLLLMCCVVCACGKNEPVDVTASSEESTPTEENVSNEPKNNFSDVVSYIETHGALGEKGIEYESGKYSFTLISSEQNNQYDIVRIKSIVELEKSFEILSLGCDLIIDSKDDSLEFYNELAIGGFYGGVADISTYNGRAENIEVKMYQNNNGYEETGDAPHGKQQWPNVLNCFLDNLNYELGKLGFSLNDLGFECYKGKTLSDYRTLKEEEVSIAYTPEETEPPKPSIGMSKTEVLNSSWGEPDKKNIDEFEWGTEEQWVYDGKGYIYFEDDVVTSIQHR